MSLKRSSLYVPILLTSVQFLIGLTASATSRLSNSISIESIQLSVYPRSLNNSEGNIAQPPLNELEAVEQLIRANPQDAGAYQKRGVIRSYSENDFQGAIEDYNKSIDLDPDNAETYNYRGTAYFRLKNYQQALLDYDRAISLNADFALAYYNRGYVRKQLGDTRGAIEDFERGANLSQQQGDTDTYKEALEVIRELQK